MTINHTLALLALQFALIAFLPVEAQQNNAQLPQKSVAQGDQKVSFLLTNNTAKIVIVIWIGFDGNPEIMGQLGPGQSTPIETYPGHLFQVVQERRVLSSYRATAAASQQHLAQAAAQPQPNPINRPPAPQPQPNPVTLVPQPGPNGANAAPAARAQQIHAALGRGYDAVRACYLDPNMIRQAIFDIQNADYNYVGLSGTARFKDDFHRSTTEYSKYLGGGATVGVDYGLFSGEMELNASSSTSGSTDRAYYNLFEVRTQYSATLHTRQTGPAAFAPTARVNATALQNLNSMHPDDVIRNYGTHYLAGLGFGGAALFTRSELSSRHSTSEEMELKVTASYGAVSGSSDLNNSRANTDASQEVKSTLRLVGGDVGSAVNSINIQGQMAQAQGAYSQWTNSIAVRPGLSEFLDDGLLPIWTVPGLRPDRVSLLKSAVEAYAKKNATPLFESKPRRALPDLATVSLAETMSGTPSGKFIGVSSTDADYIMLLNSAAGIRINKAAGQHSWAYGLSVAEIDRQKGTRYSSHPMARFLAALSAKDIQARAELRNGDTVSIEHDDRELYVGENYSKAYWTTRGDSDQHRWKIWIKGVPGNDNRAVMEGDLVALESVGYPNEHLQREGGDGYMDALSASEEQSEGASDGVRRYFVISEKTR